MRHDTCWSSRVSFQRQRRRRRGWISFPHLSTWLLLLGHMCVSANVFIDVVFDRDTLTPPHCSGWERYVVLVHGLLNGGKKIYANLVGAVWNGSCFTWREQHRRRDYWRLTVLCVTDDDEMCRFWNNDRERDASAMLRRGIERRQMFWGVCYILLNNY